MRKHKSKTSDGFEWPLIAHILFIWNMLAELVNVLGLYADVIIVKYLGGVRVSAMEEPHLLSILKPLVMVVFILHIIGVYMVYIKRRMRGAYIYGVAAICYCIMGLFVPLRVFTEMQWALVLGAIVMYYRVHLR